MRSTSLTLRALAGARGTRGPLGRWTRTALFAAALAGAAGAGPVSAQDPDPEPSVSAGPASLWAEITPRLNIRARAEFASQPGFPPKDESLALTARARFGLLSGEWAGLQAYAELEHTEALDSDRYNAIPGAMHSDEFGPTRKVVIADPESNELNQAWLAYASPIGRFQFGRQRIVLENSRFIGNVGWRQNEQTYDALAYRASPAKGVNLFYAWAYNVNRIFGSKVQGSEVPDGSGLRNWDSRSHFVQASYAPIELAKLTTYSYLLDLQQSKSVDRGSSNTYGASVTGKGDVGSVSLSYRAEYAHQTDAADNPVDFQTKYYHVSAALGISGVTVGAAREVLFDDDSAGVAFSTPLATLHAFNGFADVFLATPGNGLVDNYAFVRFPLPLGLGGQLIFHDFDSVSGGMDYGYEIDAVLTFPLPGGLRGAFKAASYNARDGGYRDTLRLWGQIEYALN